MTAKPSQPAPQEPEPIKELCWDCPARKPPASDAERAYPSAEEYKRRNPLGGVARAFDIMADRLRAGFSLDSVLADFSYARADEPAPLHAAQQPAHTFDVNGPASGYADQPAGEPTAILNEIAQDLLIMAEDRESLETRGVIADCVRRAWDAGFAEADRLYFRPAAAPAAPPREHDKK